MQQSHRNRHYPQARKHCWDLQERRCNQRGHSKPNNYKRFLKRLVSKINRRHGQRECRELDYR